jgi:hypothetical protein
MKKPVSVRALPGYRIELRYSDGVEGIVDLSEMVGDGVFVAWNDPKLFERVEIGDCDQIRWNDELELCSDALYMEITGLTPEEYFALSKGAARA